MFIFLSFLQDASEKAALVEEQNIEKHAITEKVPEDKGQDNMRRRVTRCFNKLLDTVGCILSMIVKL